MTQPLEIVYRRPQDLVAYEKNSRTHTPAQIKAVQASIREFGFTNPVLLKDDDKTIGAGHARTQAAIREGLDTIPTITLHGLTDTQWRAYVIADNSIGLNGAGWDFDLLSSELDRLGGEGFDLSLLNFDDDELAKLLDTPADGLTDPDDVPEVPATPTSVPGDIWLLGPHRVMCGDSTSAEAIATLTAGQLVDMWLTDPPYNVAYEGKTKDALKIQNDSMSDTNFRAFLCAAYAAADTAMKPGAVFYIWHADSEGYNFRGAAQDAGWKVRQCLIWSKSTMVLGRQDYQWQHEPCLYGWKDGAGHLWASDRKQTTILQFDKPARNGEHPTMKPVDLFEYQIGNNTKGGDIVLDSFGGSGTTLIACERTGRVARLMELDPCYADVIVRRWEQHTGRQATHEATGRTFADIAENGRG